MSPVPLEHLHEGDWAGLNRVVDTLRSLVLDTGGRSLGVRIGTGSATWAATGVSSGTATIAHGLGRTPVYAKAGSQNALREYAVTSRDATNIVVTGYRTDNVAPGVGTTNFDWVVIG